MNAFITFGASYFFVKAAFDLLRVVLHRDRGERMGSAFAFVAHVCFCAWAVATLVRA